MNFDIVVELINRFCFCKECGNKMIGKTESGIIIDENGFYRFCKCGWEYRTDKDGNEIVYKCPNCKEIEMRRRRDGFRCNNCGKNMKTLSRSEFRRMEHMLEKEKEV